MLWVRHADALPSYLKGDHLHGCPRSDARPSPRPCRARSGVEITTAVQETLVLSGGPADTISIEVDSTPETGWCLHRHLRGVSGRLAGRVERTRWHEDPCWHRLAWLAAQDEVSVLPRLPQPVASAVPIDRSSRHRIPADPGVLRHDFDPFRTGRLDLERRISLRAASSQQRKEDVLASARSMPRAQPPRAHSAGLVGIGAELGIPGAKPRHPPSWSPSRRDRQTVRPRPMACGEIESGDCH